MSMNDLHDQRAKFVDFELKLSNARKMEEMQSKAADARREPDMASMTAAELNAAIEAHAAGGVERGSSGARSHREARGSLSRLSELVLTVQRRDHSKT